MQVVVLTIRPAGALPAAQRARPSVQTRLDRPVMPAVAASPRRHAARCSSPRARVATVRPASHSSPVATNPSTAPTVSRLSAAPLAPLPEATPAKPLLSVRRRAHAPTLKRVKIAACPRTTPSRWTAPSLMRCPIRSSKSSSTMGMSYWLIRVARCANFASVSCWRSGTRRDEPVRPDARPHQLSLPLNTGDRPVSAGGTLTGVACLRRR